MKNCECGCGKKVKNRCRFRHGHNTWPCPTEESQKARREKRRRESAEWQSAHPDRIKASRKAWDQANAERKKRKSAEYRKTAKGKAVKAAWVQTNPEKTNDYDRRRRARKMAAPGTGVSREQWKQIVASYCGLCAHCAKPCKATMDHIDPLSKGGSHDPTNVGPVCGRCNRSKNKTTLLVWLALRAA